jgi:perosamine synthetase
VAIVSDACHALGASLQGTPAGALGDLSAFSFHPVKHITTCEGGAITTDDECLAARMRLFRNHGITSDHRQREAAGAFFYEMTELGYNYRLSDVLCALGLRQLDALPEFLRRRRAVAAAYDAAFATMPEIRPLQVLPDRAHAYHLYVIQLALERLRASRAEVFAALRAEGIGVNVHYVPVHLHPFYRRRFGTAEGLCPSAEAAYERLITLPLFPDMTERDTADVVAALDKVVAYYRN